MAVNEPYKYPSGQKQYQIITDFSKGVDTKNADSILKDNTARDITNFTIEAGGVLVKRRGITPVLSKDNNDLQKSLVDFMNRYFKQPYSPNPKIQILNQSGKLFQVDLDGIASSEIIETYKFNSGYNDIISVFAKIHDVNDGSYRYVIIDYIFRNDNVDETQQQQSVLQTMTIVDVFFEYNVSIGAFNKPVLKPQVNIKDYIINKPVLSTVNAVTYLYNTFQKKDTKSDFIANYNLTLGWDTDAGMGYWKIIENKGDDATSKLVQFVNKSLPIPQTSSDYTSDYLLKNLVPSQDPKFKYVPDSLAFTNVNFMSTNPQEHINGWLYKKGQEYKGSISDDVRANNIIFPINDGKFGKTTSPSGGHYSAGVRIGTYYDKVLQPNSLDVDDVVNALVKFGETNDNQSKDAPIVNVQKLQISNTQDWGFKDEEDLKEQFFKTQINSGDISAPWSMPIGENNWDLTWLASQSVAPKYYRTTSKNGALVFTNAINAGPVSSAIDDVSKYFQASGEIYIKGETSSVLKLNNAPFEISFNDVIRKGLVTPMLALPSGVLASGLKFPIPPAITKNGDKYKASWETDEANNEFNAIYSWYGSEYRIENFYDFWGKGKPYYLFDQEFKQGTPITGFDEIHNLYISSIMSNYSGNAEFKIPAKKVGPQQSIQPPKDVYVPDTMTFDMFSYNMLTLNDITDLNDFVSPNNDTWNSKYELTDFIDIQSRKSENYLLSPVLLNAFIPYNGVELFYLIGEVFASAVPPKLFGPDFDETKNEGRWLYYTVMSANEWNRNQTAYKTYDDYLNNFLVPKVFVNATKSKGIGNIAKVKYDSKDNYLLIITSLPPNKADKNGRPYTDGGQGKPKPVTSSDYLQITLNVTTEIPVSENFKFLNNLEKFAITDKSISFKNQIIKYGNSNTMFISYVNNGTYFPMTNFFSLPINQDITAIKPFFKSLIIQTQNHQYLLNGDTPANMKIEELNSSVGCIAPKTSVNNKNQIFSLNEEGVWATLSTRNFEDRMNVKKVNSSIYNSTFMKDDKNRYGNYIYIEEDACAVLFKDKYYLHTPSTNEIWVYYNEFQSWIRLYSGASVKYTKGKIIKTDFLFDFQNMYVIDNEIILMKRIGLIPYQFSPEDYTPALDIKTSKRVFTDTIVSSNNNKVVQVDTNIDSVYLTKEIDFGLPNHMKRFKVMHIGFEDTPEKADLKIEAWVDGSQVVNVNDNKVNVLYNKHVQLNQPQQPTFERLPNAHTNPQAKYNLGTWEQSKQNNNINQLVAVVLAAQGRTLHLRLEHSVQQQLNVSNFGFVMKIKKPKTNNRFKGNNKGAL